MPVTVLNVRISSANAAASFADPIAEVAIPFTALPRALIPPIMASEIRFALIISPRVNVFLPASSALSPNSFTFLAFCSVGFAASFIASALSLSSFSRVFSLAVASLTTLCQSAVTLLSAPCASMLACSPSLSLSKASLCFSTCFSSTSCRLLSASMLLSLLSNSVATTFISELSAFICAFIVFIASRNAFSPSIPIRGPIS